MIGYSLSGSLFTNPRSKTPLTCCSTSSFKPLPFFPLLLGPFFAFISLSTFSTSSKAFLKSFCPPCRSVPRSSISSRARKRRRRSLSDSANRRIGWPFCRRRRIVSSFEMLNWVSDGAGESVSPLFMSLEPRRGAGESVPDLEGTYPPFQGQLFIIPLPLVRKLDTHFQSCGFLGSIFSFLPFHLFPLFQFLFLL